MKPGRYNFTATLSRFGKKAGFWIHSRRGHTGRTYFVPDSKTLILKDVTPTPGITKTYTINYGKRIGLARLSAGDTFTFDARVREDGSLTYPTRIKKIVPPPIPCQTP